MTSQIIPLRYFAHEAAEWIAGIAREAIAERGLFRVALAGGETPRAVHEALAGKKVDWSHVQVTFGDERCVPPEDADSNYRMAKESLFDRVSIPDGNVFRIRGEIAPEEAAREYENKLAAVAARFGETRYVHDLVLLGMGPDGHTASLFPGSLALDETVRNIIPATGSKPPPQRITMTFPLLNAARKVCFLVKSAEKLPLVEQIVAGDETLPAGRVRSRSVTWLVG
ncbi:MAG: 6-phosphogluconolactonase [Chthoniobacteraceae bacterium]